LDGLGCIDEPADLQCVGKFVRVAGWVIAPSSSLVQVFVDDKRLGEINPFIDRGDVKQALPNIKITRPIGFDQLLEMPPMSEGPHTLSIRFEKDDGPPGVICARKIEYSSQKHSLLGSVVVEMSRLCNFRCDMCPAHSQRGHHLEERLTADDALIDRVICFLKDPQYSVKDIAAGAVWGEPLMDINYFANTKRIAEASLGASVLITTNGSLLTPENIDRILNSTYVRQVAVSVDAGTPETYEAVRKGGKWELLMGNLSALIEERRERGLMRPLVSTNFVVMRSNFTELPAYIAQMAGLGVDMIGAVNVHGLYSSDVGQGIFDLPWKASNLAHDRERVLSEALRINLPSGVSLRLPSFVPYKKHVECSFHGASTMFIGIQGEVYPCCVIQSLNYEGHSDAESMGNIFRTELQSIWNSRKYIDFRQKMLKGMPPTPICVKCPFFYGM
jgi:radical SAM protein with 4Fe4S-binding SPASM domain